MEAIKLPDQAEKALMALRLEVPGHIVDELRVVLIAALGNHQSLLQEREAANVRIAELESYIADLKEECDDAIYRVEMVVQSNRDLLQRAEKAEVYIGKLEAQLPEAKARAKDGRARAMTKINRLRTALDKAIGAYHVIRSMAHKYAEAGGETGPEMRDWNEAERLILEASKALAPEPGKSDSKIIDETLDDALKRIYERYGSDLPAFFRGAYAEYQKGKSS